LINGRACEIVLQLKELPDIYFVPDFLHLGVNLR